ncbi:hypothetical protein HG530_008072 [Fusarium avenaceum]|nr:hypothetical protein HG530_008072 [Fusarium avenaceum]
MRFTNSALQLLVLYRLASASPCKPSAVLSTTIADSTLSTTVSISTSVQETETSTIVLSQPTTIKSETISDSSHLTTIESETISDSTQPSTTSYSTQPTTTESKTSSESTWLTTIESETTSDSLTTSSSEPSTIAASTTTTVASGPFNLLLNPGFEDVTVDPWQRIGSYGSVSLSDDSFKGDHSGRFTLSNGPGMGTWVGFRQYIDPSKIKIDALYEYTVHFKTTATGGCSSQQYLTCSYDEGFYQSTPFNAPLGQWGSMTTLCAWDERWISRGPSVEVQTRCEAWDILIDEAVLTEVPE